MVLLADIVRKLDCEAVVSSGDRLGIEIESYFAAHLMSNVLASSRAGAVLLTGLTTVQAVHTADIADFRAVVFVGGKRPAPDAARLAELRGVPLFVTRYGMIEACSRLAEYWPAATGG
ncbi:MAG: transcriptional regulator [Acidobacteria bacterium]|nr:transcriptional regulator [Acidobacteriota bacterium]